MSEVENKEIEEVRAKARDFREKVKNDPELQQKLRDDPAKTLKDFEFPDKAIQDILKVSDLLELELFDSEVCDHTYKTYCISANETYVICTDTTTCIDTVFY